MAEYAEQKMFEIMWVTDLQGPLKKKKTQVLDSSLPELFRFN